MNKIILIIILLFNFNPSFSQNIEKDNVKRTYEIDLDGFQKIRFIKNRKNNYRGVIINYTYRYGIFRTRIKVSKRTKLNKEAVKYLMSDLYDSGMDTLKSINCWKLLQLKKINKQEFANCMDSNEIFCLDGDGSSFKIKIGKISNIYSFDCINPKEKITDNTPKRRKHALTILKIINDKINLDELTKDFFKGLRKGSYKYYGISTLQIN